MAFKLKFDKVCSWIQPNRERERERERESFYLPMVASGKELKGGEILHTVGSTFMADCDKQDYLANKTTSGHSCMENFSCQQLLVWKNSQVEELSG